MRSVNTVRSSARNVASTFSSCSCADTRTWIVPWGQSLAHTARVMSLYSRCRSVLSVEILSNLHLHAVGWFHSKPHSAHHHFPILEISSSLVRACTLDQFTVMMLYVWPMLNSSSTDQWKQYWYLRVPRMTRKKGCMLTVWVGFGFGTETNVWHMMDILGVLDCVAWICLVIDSVV